jgi:hypothetical protein
LADFIGQTERSDAPFQAFLYLSLKPGVGMDDVPLLRHTVAFASRCFGYLLVHNVFPSRKIPARLYCANFSA